MPTTTLLPDGHTTLEHEIAVPLDPASPGGPTVTLFAREVVAPGGEGRPYLVFLQGGPGGEADRPTFSPTAPGWLTRALRDFRVLLLDQRGTGRSAPLGDLVAMSPAAQAAHVTHFRADAIVADCEAMRRHLGVERWSVLGQSFGGFCAFTYLSVAPGSLAAVYLTGGAPPIGAGPDAVYPSTYATMRERSRLFYERYPDDLARMRRLLVRCDAGEVLLPDGEPVTARRLRHVGHVLGMSYGAERLHHLLERDPTSPRFRHDLGAAMSFGARDPLYALLQEACYADGGVTDWSAERLLPAAYDDPTLFFGEHLFPASFADAAELHPYAEAADLLARHPWPALYDLEVLAANTVPGAAAVYARDAYVDRELSLATLARVPGIEPWVTDAHEHDGLRTSGEEVLGHLFTLVPPPTA